MNRTTILVGDAVERLRDLPDGSARACVTSPPYYGLRDYGAPGQIGLEPRPEDYVARLVEVFREVRRVLSDDGTLWLNLGDCYAATGKSGGGSQGERWERSGADFVGPRGGKWRPAPPGLKPKDLVGIPWTVAFALRAEGWYLRSDIIWAKPNPMPESVEDRPTKSHEYLFLLAKSERYYFDSEAVRLPVSRNRKKGGGPSFPMLGDHVRASGSRGKQARRIYDTAKGANVRSVWTVRTRPFSGAHFATFPPALIERCVLAGCPRGGTVLDPFGGAGTTALVANRLGRDAVLVEINPSYAEIARTRVATDSPLFSTVEFQGGRS